MPRYVFEVNVTLAAGDDLSVEQCNQVTAALQGELAATLATFGKRRGRIGAELPFEHVTGDWTEPDAEGFLHPTGARSIDL